MHRNHAIDLLRGVAISCVLMLHFALAYGVKDSPLGTLLPAWLLQRWVWNGNYGVTLFFTISGYLITAQSQRRWGALAQTDLASIYVLRIARIMPMLLLALAIIVALGCAGMPYFANTDNGQHLPSSFFVPAAGSVLSFWHNLLMQHVGYFNYSLNVYWSLSVEEVFYLAMPGVWIVLRRPRLIAAGCAALIVAGPIYRALHGDNEIDYLYGYLACFDAIAMGCVAALIAPGLALSPRQRTGLVGVALVLVAASYLRGIGGHEVFGFTWVALCCALYLVGAARLPPWTGWAEKLSSPLRWLGRHSYELYLFHIIVLALLRNLLSRDALGYWTRLPVLGAFLGASVLVAAGAARYLAEPANQAIRNWHRARSGQCEQRPLRVR